jgi:protein TonB
VETVCQLPPFEVPVPTGRKPRARLPRFLLVSVLLHAGLFLSGIFAFQLGAQRETVLTVNFDAPDQPQARAVSDASARRNSPLQNRKIDALATAPAAHAVESQTASTAVETDTGADTERSTEYARARVEARLLADLQRYFEYPPLARRQGWQGIVWLAFVVQSDGALERIHVARSSGYDLLDRSAIAALRRVEPLSDTKQWLYGRALEMNIPVVYRLKDY